MTPLLPGLSGATDIHPLFVHFPVALWPTAAAFYAYGVFRDHEGARQTGRWVAYAGVLSAVAALGTGFLAADRLGHDSPGHDLVHTHRNLMIGATTLVLLASAAARAAVRGSARRLQFVALGLLLAGVLTTVFGADRGAHLVYGVGLGVSKDAGAASPAGGSGHHDAAPGGHDHGGHAH